MLGQAVMTSVMSMTPVHLRHSDASLRVIGLVISVHIAGMYAASPLVGWAVDRIGRKQVIATGCLILLASFAIAGTANGHESVQLGIGLTLLGLGWSCTMIAGSTLLTDAVPMDLRPNVQGTADVLMGFGGATAGLLAGLVVSVGSYALLTVISTALILPLLMVTLLVQPRSLTQPA
jgi:MFS family permease